MNFETGDIIKCIFNQVLPGNDKGPNLEISKEYLVERIHHDKGGNPHIGVGLPLTIGYVTSYATREELPPTEHWCHPNRFVLVRKANISSL